LILSQDLYPSTGISTVAYTESPLVFSSCSHFSNDHILIVFALLILPQDIENQCCVSFCGAIIIQLYNLPSSVLNIVPSGISTFIFSSKDSNVTATGNFQLLSDKSKDVFHLYLFSCLLKPFQINSDSAMSFWGLTFAG
jgi:hypothetical protein